VPVPGKGVAAASASRVASLAGAASGPAAGAAAAGGPSDATSLLGAARGGRGAAFLKKYSV
jgi:hypothetical protein